MSAYSESRRVIELIDELVIKLRRPVCSDDIVGLKCSPKLRTPANM